ncbi:hypothetical protein EDB81DRAFT_96810 [Dactylonectria macrodidyma]|uniref:Uncharacterized protein n=1 Tax=Dactylonectria macrodidyma TaxID=307937 RepID=A0A9P9EBC9_9HYPO|nr:hypothetical protein EDB81DRAFT_96810 [Dactylonectria macrodidyma]
MMDLSRLSPSSSARPPAAAFVTQHPKLTIQDMPTNNARSYICPRISARTASPDTPAHPARPYPMLGLCLVARDRQGKASPKAQVFGRLPQGISLRSPVPVPLHGWFGAAAQYGKPFVKTRNSIIIIIIIIIINTLITTAHLSLQACGLLLHSPQRIDTFLARLIHAPFSALLLAAPTPPPQLETSPANLGHP